MARINRVSGVRKRWIWILMSGLLLSLGTNIVFFVQQWQSRVVATVPDGDSLQLADGRRVRLLGVDAPERGRCLADAARTRLTSLAQGRHVRLKNIVIDDYGRILAHVIVEEPDSWLAYLIWKLNPKGPMPDPFLNRVVVSEGLARFSGAHDEYYDTLKVASEKAKLGELGIYSPQCRGLTPKSSECMIKGNIREGEKTYYLPECRYYDQVIIDQSYGDAWFCDEAAAQAANYIKSENCL